MTTSPNPNHAEEARDWADDAADLAGEGAFVSMSFDSGYKDFLLSPSQVQAVFAALATHAARLDLTQDVTP